MSTKIAFITGITGQDGTYLAELLLRKGYIVHALKRRASSNNNYRIEHLLNESNKWNKNFYIQYGYLTDASSIFRLVKKFKPDEIYNLAAQSHVHTSFENPEYTADVDALGTLRILEAIRLADLETHTKFYQASTSELYGKVQEPVQNEETPFYPRSPYAIAKQYAFWITKNYRESYKIFACNGILFNHESPIRGEAFVTRKITQAVARIREGRQDFVCLGNLDAKRDWGHAKEYVEGMWKMLQTSTPEDYVLATNKTTTIRDFLKMAFKYVGISLIFEGTGLNEIARCSKSGTTVVKISPEFYRPAEVKLLLGDASKALKNLDWQTKITLHDLCEEMMLADILRCRKEMGIGGIKTPEDFVKECGSYSTWYEYAKNLL